VIQLNKNAAVKKSEREHLDKIRDRFTNTAGPFAEFVLSRRTEEVEGVIAALTRGFEDAASAVAMDLACGPGTFVRALGRRVARAVGVDFTPAMLARAHREAEISAQVNLTFVCADAGALPFADASLDIALCGYALHHLLAPAQAVREMARVVRPGGRVAVVDLVIPEGADGDAHNHIERVRDPSHAATLSAAELRGLFREVGLRELAAEPHQRQRDFDEWMRVAGHAPGSAAYTETRRLLESIAGNTAGYSPRRDSAGGALQFTQVAIFLLAEKR
jgi:ubiquinone/menaquinone biosynthesis C-methylase UbiE